MVASLDGVLAGSTWAGENRCNSSIRIGEVYFNVGVNLHLLHPPMTTCCNPVSDEAKTSGIGCCTLANGVVAKQPFVDLLKELAVEYGFKKTQNSTFSMVTTKQQ